MSWTDHRVEDCVLDDADLTNLRCWGVHVARSRLRRARLHHAQPGAGPAARFPPSLWCDLDLTSADLRASTAAHATLERAELGSARLAGAHWTSLVDCRFAGVVDGLTLGGSVVGENAEGVRLRGVDLSRARIRRLRLVGVDLGHPSVDLTLPEDDGHWVVPSWPAFLTRGPQRVPTVRPGGYRPTRHRVSGLCPLRRLGHPRRPAPLLWRTQPCRRPSGTRRRVRSVAG